MIAIAAFLIVIAITIAITVWAARRASDRSQLYAAGGSLSAGQNGLAIAGDFISASTLLGTTALFFDAGPDALLYLLPFLAGMGLMVLWVAGPVRRLGRFTLGEVITAAHPSPMLRRYAGVATITISLVYLVAQLVGAGNLISILFGFSFESSVVVVGVLMAVYVTFGGMLAATWIQVVKAVLLVAAVIVLVGLCLVEAGGLSALYERAQTAVAFKPGGLKLDAFSAVSLVTGLALGTVGLPHLLIRAFTVPDAATARRSLAIGAVVVGVVVSLVFAVLGPATLAFVKGQAAFQAADGEGVLGGSNMAVVHLASALAGPVAFGVMSAIVFATILAVVAGLTITIATAAARDVAAAGAQDAASTRRELWLFRASAGVAALVAVAASIGLQHQNIAVLISLALGLAASANFPVLVLAIYWRGLTTAGAFAAGAVGLTSATTLIALGPAVWVKLLHHAQPVFPSDHPTLIAAPLAFLAAWLVSRFGPPQRA